MYITSFDIDRYGPCANRSVELLSDGLNVLHGPVGSQKELAARFIRSVLYEGPTEFNSSGRPLNVAGRIATSTADGTRVVTRHAADPGREPLVTYHDGHGHIVDDSITEGVSAAEFDHLFCVNFRHRPSASALIDEASCRGIDLHEQTGLSAHGIALEKKLRSHRDALATVPRVDLSVESLLQERSRVLTEIDQLEAAVARRVTINSQREHRDSQIASLASQLDQLDDDIEQTTQQLASARRRHDDLSTAPQPVSPHHVGEAQLVELRELDEQLTRWRATLTDIVSRAHALEEQDDAHAWDEATTTDPREHLRAVESRIEELQQLLPGTVGTDCRCAEFASRFGPALTEVREHVYQICLELGAWQSTAQHTALNDELAQARRCEAELRDSIARAGQRRQELIREIRQAGGNVAKGPWNEAWCECDEHPELTLSPVVETRVDPRLGDLSAEIESLQRELNRLLAERGEVSNELQRLRHAENIDDSSSHLASLERLDAARAELRRLQQQLRDAQRRRELLTEIESMEEELQKIDHTSHSSVHLSHASEYLRRLSAGDLRSIDINAERNIWVIDEHDQRRPYHQLSDGDRDVVYLALAMACVEAYGRRGVRLPMLLTDVFTHVPAKNVPEACELLRDFAQRGHQVILLTPHEHVASVCRQLNVPVKRWDPVESFVDTTTLETSPLEEIDEDDADTDPELTEHSPIEDAPSIDVSSAERLRRIGVMRIGDLLRISSNVAARELRDAGITAETIADWKAQSLLVCRVPHLRAYDARILVASGIRDPEELQRLSPREVRSMVKNMAASGNGQGVLLSGTEYELSRVTDWISDEDAKRATGHRTSRTSHRSDRSQQRSNSRRESRGSESRSSSSRSGRGSSSTRSSQSSSERRSREASDADEVIKLHAAASGEWVFHLGRLDPVVDAPSIGAKTAERLEGLGINTVSDFLETDAKQISSELHGRRYSAKVITEWQRQTELCCRIPELRGHDAQILVALGIDTPEDLAALAPHDLWSRVKPFIETKEGKRIIRSSKAPDFNEVSDWIAWAQSARTLAAA